jgi:hypothetical protein
MARSTISRVRLGTNPLVEVYVIEVRPKATWRGLRMAKHGQHTATVTFNHRFSSHWFQRTTAEGILRDRPRIIQMGRPLSLEPQQIRIMECGCRPDRL